MRCYSHELVILLPVHRKVPIFSYPWYKFTTNASIVEIPILVNVTLFFLLQFHTIAIIAEGIPENKTKQLIKLAERKGVIIIGPATVSHTLNVTS